MKYEFVEKSLDEYELHYTNTKGEEVIKPFKRSVELAVKLQRSDADARFKMLEYLTQQGKTKDDFVIKKEVNGKITYDETNYREFEAGFIENQQLQLALEIYRQLFNMDLQDLLLDMGFTDKDQEIAGKFSLELRDILINGKVKTPSIQEIKD